MTVFKNINKPLYIIGCLILLLSTITVAPIFHTSQANSGANFELINDGEGFMKAVRQENLRFDDYQSQQQYMSQLNYPISEVWNSSVNIGRDGENSILWISARPTMIYGNISTWPNDLIDLHSKFDVNSSKRIDDSEGFSDKSTYYLSNETLITMVFTALGPIDFKYFIHSTNITHCPNLSWQTQWEPCDMEITEVPTSFPIAQPSQKRGHTLVDGIAREEGFIGLTRNYLSNNQSVDDLQIGKGFSAYKNEPARPRSTNAFATLLLEGDHDNFGIKYEVTGHPAYIRIGINSGYSLLQFNNLKERGLPDNFIDQRYNASYFIGGVSGNENYPSRSNTGSVVDYGTSFVGPTGKIVMDDFHNGEKLPITKFKDSDLVPNQPVEFDFSPSNSPVLNIFNINLPLFNVALSSSAILAVIAVNTIQEMIRREKNPTSVRNRSSTEIKRAIKLNKIWRNNLER